MAVSNSHGASVICKLKAAQQIDSQTLLALLQAVENGATAFADHIFALPAAMQLPADGVAQLLAAIEKQCAPSRKDEASFRSHVLALPGLQQLSAEMLADLLDAGLQQPEHSNHSLLLKLFSVPAAQQLSSSAISKLLHTALVHEPHRDSPGLCAYLFPILADNQAAVVARLCGLPAAQQLSIHAARQLMDAVKDLQRSPCRVVLSEQLPAVREWEKTGGMAAQCAARSWDRVWQAWCSPMDRRRPG
jgi:hypothetical protein